MDWSDNDMQANFRSEVRTVIEARLPERYRDSGGSWEHDRRGRGC